MFCGTFTQPEEQYIAHLPTVLDQDFLIIPMYWPSPAPSSRLVNRWDVVMSIAPANLAGMYPPIDPALDGEYRVQLTAKGPVDFSFAVHALETVESLFVGDRRTGFYDAPHITAITQTGRYHLVLKGAAIGAPVTGSAVIRDPSLATTIPLDTTITGTLVPGAAYEFYGVELQAGDRIYVEPLTWTYPNFGFWRLFAPPGPFVTSPSPNNLSTPFAITAPTTGKYTLLLTAAGSSPFDYSFRIKKLSVEEVTGFPYDHGFGD